MTTQRMQERVVEELAGRIAGFLTERNGAVEESALVGRFRGFGRIRTLALRWLAERGHVRRTRNACGTTVVAYTITPEPVVRDTAGLHEVRKDRLAAERREALKPTPEEYGTDTEAYRLYSKILAEGRISAENVPFKLPAGREECPKAKRRRRWNGQSGSRLDFSAAAQAGQGAGLPLPGGQARRRGAAGERRRRLGDREGPARGEPADPRPQDTPPARTRRCQDGGLLRSAG